MRTISLENMGFPKEAIKIVAKGHLKLVLPSREEYNFIHKTGGNAPNQIISNTIEAKKVDDLTLKKVRDFLIDKHPSLLREALGSIPHKQELKRIINEFLSITEELRIKGMSLDELSNALVNAIAGLGVIDEILADNKDDITDIRFNGRSLWIYSNKRMPYQSPKNLTQKEAADLAMKISYATNKEFSGTVIELDAEIANLRVNGVHDSVSLGTSLAFRVMKKGVRITEENFVKTLGNQMMLDFLIACVKSKISIAIVGETGTGKTELIKFLTKFTLPHHPINVIEDTPETFMQELYPEKDIMNWVTKKSSTGAVVVDITRLTRSSLRNFPTWLIITESRGGEFFDILKAAGTGHAVMTSFHTESTQTSAQRMVLMAKEGTDLDEKMIHNLIPGAFRIVVHIEHNIEEHTRRIAGLGEYVGIDPQTQEVKTNDLFGYTIDGAEFENDSEGKTVLKTKRSFKQLHTMSDKLAEHFIANNVLSPSLIPLLSENIKSKYNIIDDSTNRQEQEKVYSLKESEKIITQQIDAPAPNIEPFFDGIEDQLAHAK